MKSYGQLWRRIISEDNLCEAWRRVRCRRSSSPAIIAFERDIDDNLASLIKDLSAGVYRPGEYRQFAIRDPKPRTISCAPVRDRVVHHALCAVIAPLLEKSFLPNSYACRKGFGMHRACRHVRREAGKHGWFVKLDIRHFFDNVDHARLKELILPMFREKAVRALLSSIIDCDLPNVEHGKGLPIGNLTSQWFANVYLNALDHLLAEELGLGNAFVRYMDDLIVLCDSKSEAWAVVDRVSRWLQDERGLELKEKATVVAPVSEGIPFLGLRIFSGCRRLQGRKFRHMRRLGRSRYLAMCKGEVDESALCRSLVAMQGALDWYGFKGVLKDEIFKAPGEGASSGLNRVNRGGSWNNNARNCRSANRNNNSPDNTNDNLGFRPLNIMPTSGQAGSNPGSPALRECEDENAIGAKRLVSEKPKDAAQFIKADLVM